MQRLKSITSSYSNNIFIIKRSFIEERIDPQYYNQDNLFLRNKLITQGFVKLGSCILSWNRGDGPRDGYYTDDAESGVYFIRVNNLKDNSIDLKDVKYIKRVVHETKLKRTQVTVGDVIFAISGTKDNLGTVSIIPENIIEANLNSALVRLDLNENKIKKEFFCLLFSLDFVRSQIEYIGKGAAQNNLNNKEISSILIPDMSIKMQTDIVRIVDKAKYLKQQQEAEAQALLDSIDGYLLKELGITLPEQDNSLEKRIFRVGYGAMSGDRFDPHYYKNIKINSAKSIYEETRLRNIATVVKGQSITKENVSEGDYPVVAGGKTSPYNHNTYNHEGNVITISASGAYAGYVWYHSNPIFASDCSVIKSKDENFISTLYLSEFLKLKQNDIYSLQQGAGQPHVYPSDLVKINIPLPPIEKQKEIVNHIQSIRNKAKQLQEEAKAILENAKQEVEKMILGE